MSGFLKLNIFGKEVSLLDYWYPIGTLIQSEDKDFDPNISWGGEWERIIDKFILAAGDTYTNVGGTGGNSSITLTSANIPSHSHTVNSHTHSAYATTTVSRTASGSVANKAAMTASVSGYQSARYRASQQDTTPKLTIAIASASGFIADSYSLSISSHSHTYTAPSFTGSTTIYSSSTSQTSSNKDKTDSRSPYTNYQYAENPTAINITPIYEACYCWKRIA